MPARATTPVPQLAPFDLDLLEIDRATICALDATLRIIYVNRAWRDFGQVNGASWSDERWTGASVLDAIPPAIRTFYANLFDEARRSHAPLEHSPEGNEWAWVPRWVARVPLNTSHGICSLCERYFFPD